ncbi:MAG: VWA domain-containing protein [Xenococcaceae cyanobacterium]
MLSKRPGGELSTRPLHFIWICDCSGSMSVNGKIQALNNAIRQTLPLMQKAAEDNVNAKVFVRALKFSDGAQWHISQQTPVEDFQWQDLNADGVTDMGKALSMVAEQLKMPPMTDRALPPVLVLISDGQPTDDFNSGLRQLMEQPWGKKAVRVAIAVGQDADYEVLQKFIGNPELKPLPANNPDQLINRIKWASTAVLKSVSSPTSQSKDSISGGMNVPIPTPVSDGADIYSDDDVW